MNYDDLLLELRTVLRTEDAPAGFASLRSYVLGRGPMLLQLLDRLEAAALAATPAPAAPAGTGEAWVPAIHGKSLPEKIGHYLCLCNDGAQMVCFLNAVGDWSAFPGARYYGDLAGGGQPQPDRIVTHWQPLPTPPHAA